MSDNTASNLGTGQGIFAQKVADDLQFKSLIGGTNVTLTSDANSITFTASNDTTALNLGTGAGLFTTKSGDNIQFKSIIANAASGISVTTNANDLTFQLVTANVDAGKLGGVVATDFLQKSDNLNSVANKATARSNLSVYSKAEIDANTLKNNANQLPDTDSTYSLGSNSYKWLNIYADNFYGRASVAGSVESIANIGDIDTSGAINGSVLKYNSSSGNWEIGVDSGGGSGSSNFVGLSDTPGNFTGDAGKFVRVNAGESALEFTTDVATQTYVNTQVANLVDSAPGTLDTLNELAAALGDDANFATTVTNSIATKLATADFNTTFDNRLATKSTTNLSEGTNLYYTDARVDTHLNQSNPTSGYVLSWNGSDYAWVAQSGGGSGDISRVNITAGTGLTGTQDTASGEHTQTLAVDVGTTAGKIVQLDGTAKLPSVDGSQLTNLGIPTNTDGLAEGSSNLYYTDTRFDTRLSSKSTTNLTEGTNLYYTDARVNTRVNALGKANWDSAYGWGDHSAAGYQTTAGLNGAIDSHLNQSNPTSGYVLSWNGSDYAWVNNAGYTDTDFDNRLATKTTANLTEGSNLYFTNARADARVQAASLTDLSNVDAVVAGDDGKVLYYDHSSTSFKWKVDASGSSYTNSDVDAHLNQSNPTNGYVLSWNGSDYAWVANGTGGITDIVNDTTPQLGGTLDANGNTIDMGTNVLTDTNLGQFITAYGWGDHGSAGYLTSVPAQSFASLTGKPTTIAGYGITDSFSGAYADLTGKPTLFDNSAFDTRLATKDTGDLAEGSNLYFTNARADGRITAAGSANWNTAYGWGDHGAAGYQTTAGLNGAIDTHLNQSNPTSGYVLSWNGSDYAWISNAGYTNTDFDNRLATKSTTNLTEGTNLYFTDARADARITNALIDEDNMASDSATRLPSQQSVKAYVDSQVASENELSEMNDVTITSVQTNQFLQYNGTAWVNVTAGTATAGGADTQIQFNDGGTINGDAGIVYNKTTNDLTVSGKILYSNVYSAEGDLPSAATYHGMFAHVHGTGKGYYAHGGNWIKLLDETSSTTSNLAEGTRLYYTIGRFDSDFNLRTTADLTEGTSLCYTQARFDSAFGAKTTGDLTEGNNLYYTQARTDSSFDARFDSSFDERLATSSVGLDSSTILDLIAFDVIGYETNTFTISTLNGLTSIDGGAVTLSTNDAFGVLQRDVYDNMEPRGRLEAIDAGAIS